MFLYWWGQSLAVAGHLMSVYGHWLQLASGYCANEAARVEPWLDVVVADAPRAHVPPRLGNCAASYYSCCQINLARMPSANDPQYRRSTG